MASDYPCQSCGYHPGRLTGPTAVETSRARISDLEDARDRIETGMVEALRAYHEYDGNAAEGGNIFAEAVEALLPPSMRVGIRDDADPPPGWERYTITDEDGRQYQSLRVRRIEPITVTVQEAWTMHDRKGER